MALIHIHEGEPDSLTANDNMANLGRRKISITKLMKLSALRMASSGDDAKP